MMKTFISVLLIVLGFSFSMQAKKVKFAVNMNAQTVSPNGIHVSGDFQTVAGFPGGDWNSATTPLFQEGTTGIFSFVVDIPAFHKYEYKFVNGDQFYEVEFVPEVSRVGHNFNDNRWIFVDSLSPDTFFVGAIPFGENAPTGLKMIRFQVDMNEVSSVSNVHVAGNFNSFNFQKTVLYNFVDKLYEVIQFVPNGSYEFVFANGNTSVNSEIVPEACANGTGKRTIQLSSDTVLTAFCFGSCAPCVTTSANKTIQPVLARLYPNPAIDGSSTLQLSGLENDIQVFNSKGQKVISVLKYSKPTYWINGLNPGLYYIRLSNSGKSQTISMAIK